ncbi:MAG: flagellar basal-body rod protein FlgF [Deltaproteobacteria bacterium]|nr:flagellar basal-body rod protein FlgF [Deltaproteobacteria bacterium]
MSLYSALYTGVTGLNANGKNLGVSGDNIANANTIGFKSSRAAFEDILGKSLISGAGETGMGTRLQKVQKMLTQGAITHTGNATDLAIQGSGFFVVDTPDGNMYTRAGQFTIDEDGDLVNLSGLKVQGFNADANGNVGGTLDAIQVGSPSLPPVATTEITLQGNLPANTPANQEYLNNGFDPNNADSYDHTTPTVIYDSLGNAIDATVYFSSTGPNTWEYNVATDGKNLEGGVDGDITTFEGGSITFDASGIFLGSTQNNNSFSPVNALQPQDLVFNFGDDTDPTAPGMTGHKGDGLEMRFVGSDGFGAGELANIQFDDNGNVIGSFTNGETQVLAQLAIADFPAADELMRVGGNLYSISPDSGDANIGTAGTGGRGSIVAGALEQSNVDLAGEFVSMIVAQRGYQASSKTISTADQLLGELIQLKR